MTSSEQHCRASPGVGRLRATTSSSRLRALIFCCGLLFGLVAGCDDSGGGDAGTDAGPDVGLTVLSAEAFPATRMGFTNLVLTLRLDANARGPLPVAPNAFIVVMMAGMRVNALPGRTETWRDGCRSTSVALGESHTCAAVFEVADGEVPITLEWSDGTITRTAMVPAVTMP